MSEQTFNWWFSYFGLFMFILAIICTFINSLIDRKLPLFEILYRWFSLLPLGFGTLYGCIMHVTFPLLTAKAIGFQDSAFQFEAGMAGLGFGLIAVLSFKASYGFRLATVIATTCWLWGDAIGHVYQISIHENLTPGNAGSWLFMGIFLPLILILSLIKLKRFSRLQGKW